MRGPEALPLRARFVWSLVARGPGTPSQPKSGQAGDPRSGSCLEASRNSACVPANAGCVDTPHPPPIYPARCAGPRPDNACSIVRSRFLFAARRSVRCQGLRGCRGSNVATDPSDSAVVLEQVAFGALRTSGEGGVEPARQHPEGLHASDFQGTITDKVARRGGARTSPLRSRHHRFTTPDTFVAAPRGLARPRRTAEVGAHLEVPQCGALDPGYPPF